MKQHLIDPEICIRCYTCEMTCPIGAIEHNEDNVVVDPKVCNYCMSCIPVCPTGSIDEWRVVSKPYSLEEQYSWTELPEQESIEDEQIQTNIEALDDEMAKLLEEAHKGAGGRVKAPISATKPTVSLYNISSPVEAVVQGNYRLTVETSDIDIRHIILDFQGKPMPVLEGQSIGIIAPQLNKNVKPHLPRLYSVSSPRDGERPGYNNVSLTVKREEHGVCSNYICDLKKGDKVSVVGPFGSSFLIPEDKNARMLMICTGTGSAPMRAFTMRRQRTIGSHPGGMLMFFGARAPDCLPYLGPLNKLPDTLLKKHLVFSRQSKDKKEYVQDRMLSETNSVTEMLNDPNTHIYICGLKQMESGVDQSLSEIASSIGQNWQEMKNELREAGRFHVETY